MSSVLKNGSETVGEHRGPNGFTMMELVMVLVILVILSAIAVPVFVCRPDFESRTAAEVLAGDVRYAQALAVRQNNGNPVVFDINSGGYRIRDDSGEVKRVEFGAGHYESFSDTTITGVDFTFDRNGTPSPEQEIEVTSGTRTLHVTIERQTGRAGIY
ncbi:MAG: GspH/FimT family pseudopilin [Pseudomonadota bacterium]